MSKDTLAFTTAKGFYLIDAMNGKLCKVREGRIWGLTWDRDYLYLGEWKKGGGIIDIHILDKKFRICDTYRSVPECKLVAAHQMVYHDGRIWIANTMFDLIATWVVGTDEWYQWRPEGLTHDKRDEHHLNGCWYDAAKKEMLIVCHNGRDPSFINGYSYPDLRLTWTADAIGRHIHNVWREGEELFYCSSLDGEVRRLRDCEPVAVTGNYTRGVAVTDKIRVIGSSKVEQVDRNKRLYGDGGLFVYNKDWELLHRLSTHGCGQVYEVRALNTTDLSHWPGSEEMKFEV